MARLPAGRQGWTLGRLSIQLLGPKEPRALVRQAHHHERSRVMAMVGSVIILVCFFASTFVLAQERNNVEAVTAEINRSAEDFMKYFAAKDIDKIMENLTADFVYENTQGIQNNPSQFKGMLQKETENLVRISYEKPEISEVELTGENEARAKFVNSYKGFNINTMQAVSKRSSYIVDGVRINGGEWKIKKIRLAK